MKIFGGAVVAPVVADAAGGVVENPKVRGRCFPGAGGEETQWGFVPLQVVVSEGFAVNGFGDGNEQAEALQGPVVEGVTRNADTTSL